MVMPSITTFFKTHNLAGSDTQDCDPSTQEAEGGGSLEFKDSLVYRVLLQRKPVLKNKNKKEKNKKDLQTKYFQLIMK